MRLVLFSHLTNEAPEACLKVPASPGAEQHSSPGMGPSRGHQRQGAPRSTLDPGPGLQESGGQRSEGWIWERDGLQGRAHFSHSVIGQLPSPHWFMGAWGSGEGGNGKTWGPFISPTYTEKFVLFQEVETIASVVASIHTHRLSRFAASWWRSPRGQGDASGWRSSAFAGQLEIWFIRKGAGLGGVYCPEDREA